MNKPLRASLSLALVILVGSCGVENSTPSTGQADPSVTKYQYRELVGVYNNRYGLHTWCVGKDKMFISGGYSAVAVIHNHEDCGGK